MSLHTPVVFAQSPQFAAQATARDWLVVSRSDALLHLTGVTQSAPLPGPTMDIANGSLSGAQAPGWRFVLDWIAKYAHRPLLVVEPGSWTGDLARWAQATRGWPWVVTDDLATLPDTALIDGPVPPTQPSPADRIPGTGRLLLVRHGAPTQRQNDWISAAESAGLVVDVASDRPVPDLGRVHVVPDLGVANLAPSNGPIDPVYGLALTRAISDQDPTLGVAGSWQVALERWFEARPDEFDVVVLTGPPVGFLGFGAFAARHWYAKVVIDHETHADWPTDPTAATLAKDWERGWHLAADAVTVAAEPMLDLVTATGPEASVDFLEPASMGPLLSRLADHSFQVG